MKTIRILMPIILFLLFIPVFAGDDLNGTQLTFGEDKGNIKVEFNSSCLNGPYYLKTDYFIESGTNIVHLKYIVIQNPDLCKKNKISIPVKWILKNTGITKDNRKKYRFQLDQHRISLSTKEIKEILKILS